MYPILDDLRQRCPIARTEPVWRRLASDPLRGRRGHRPRHRAFLVPVGHHGQLPAAPRPGPGRWLAARTSDPPFHHDARKLLLPAFTKAAVSRREPATRALCHSLIDELEGQDVVDAARDYAQHIPMRVIAGILGFPAQDAPRFAEFVKNTLEGVNLPPQQRTTRMSALFHYLLAQVQDHLRDPRDDLTTYLINAELDGRRLDPPHIIGTMTLLLIAGIDTTWSAIGASLWHLAKNPEDRRRLVADRACCRPRSRSSCGPTRRSRWRGWSRRT